MENDFFQRLIVDYSNPAPAPDEVGSWLWLSEELVPARHQILAPGASAFLVDTGTGLERALAPALWERGMTFCVLQPHTKVLFPKV